MNNQAIKFDIKQIKPEALNLFYSHIIKECHLARKDKEIYDEYLEWKKKRNQRSSDYKINIDGKSIAYCTARYSKE